MEKELVNHPSHYNEHKFECIDEMEIVFGTVAVINFCKINAWKYRNRAGYKDSTEQEMKKVDWYLSKAKELEEKVNSGNCIPSLL